MALMAMKNSWLVFLWVLSGVSVSSFGFRVFFLVPVVCHCRKQMVGDILGFHYLNRKGVLLVCFKKWLGYNLVNLRYKLCLFYYKKAISITLQQ